MAPRESSLIALRRAIKVAGGQAPFARLVGCTQGNIWQMLRDNRPLSARFVLKAEAQTGISRHDLRPDLYPRESILPERPGPSDQLEPVA